MQADDTLLQYIGSLDNSLRELNRSYKNLDDKVDAHIKDDNIRISSLENAAAVSIGIKGAERRRSDKVDRLVTMLISGAFSAVIALSAAWIDRQTTGDSNATTFSQIAADPLNRASRPAGRGQ